MKMKTHKFARKPFYVDAVRVSEANIEEVAEWCEGEIKTDDEGKRYIHIKVYRPLNEKQTQAYLGDWVLLAGTGFKVYIPKAFDKSFEKVKHLTRAQADEAGIKVPHEPSQPPERVKVKQKGTENEAVINPAEKPPTPAVMPKQKDEADKLIEEVLRNDPNRTRA
jgi:hypothetical protein